MKENNPIDNYFRRSLEGHEVKASPGVWERVVAETKAGSNSGTSWYGMRAAAILLMFSVGTWLIINRSQKENSVVIYPSIEFRDGVEESKAQKSESPKKMDLLVKGDNPAKEQEGISQHKRVAPILKQSQLRRPNYLNNEPMVEVDESLLIDDRDIELASIELAPSELAAYGQPSPLMKLQLSQPGREASFYAEIKDDSTNENLKSKVYAYANTQFDNLRNGRPLELPRTGKPQLQINLDRLFNN
jgi:hypothetical protein